MKHALLTLLALLFCTQAHAQTPRPYHPIQVPTRDGETLAADLYASDTTVAKPVILIQTPYNKNFYRLAVTIPDEAGGASFPYDSARYHYVTLDWRGFHGSKGAEAAGYDRGLDGYDAVEWIAGQSWCNGKIGTWGGSALGAIQFMTAKHRPPHLVCSVPLIKDFKTKYSDYFYGGVFRREHVESLGTLAPVNLILEHPTKDIYWNIVERSSDYPDSIAVPMLLISGWFDHYPDDIIRAFHDLRDRSHASVRPRHRLIMGPWTHSGIGLLKQGALEFPKAVGSADSMALRFFEHYLLGVENGYDDLPPVRYYQMGADEWRSTEDWYQHVRRGDTLRLYVQADGALLPTPQLGEPAPDPLRFDPRDPSPTFGGARLTPFDKSIVTGPQEQRDSVLSRSDVLVYQTPILNNPIEINGGVQVHLYVSSDREDTDFGVRLCDVHPDGRSILLTQGIRRMRFRNGFRPQDTAAMAGPSTVYPVVIELQNIAITLQPGHRLQVIVSSSNYPVFDINPNTGGPLYAPGDTLVANNRVHHSLSHPSRVVFPVTEGTSSIDESDGASSLRLEPNYPNPFSASTTIAFNLPERAHVMLDIVDLFGGVRAHLADQTFDAGRHRLTLDGTALPAGAYICRLKAGGSAVQRVIQIVR